MAYNAVAQADLDVVSNASDPASRTPSPQLRRANEFQPVPLNTTNLGGDGYMEPASEDSGLGRLGSVIRSIGTTNYEVLEEDDYEVAQPAMSPKSPDLPMRGSSIRQSLPLDQPTPDLQALQGAYVGNVERLERSAECLSSSSADIGSEIRRIDQEQKIRSGSSASNSIVDRNSGHSSYKHAPESQAPFSHSTRSRSASGSQLAQIVEPEHDHVHGEASDRIPTSAVLPPIYKPTQIQLDFGDQDHTDTVVGNDVGRPASVASNDTYQQARTLFTDFDGVHFVSDESGGPTRNVSLTRPPLARGSQPHEDPQVGEHMVYYPAPVPMMLNLPPRLSRNPNETAEREKRRTQLLNSVLPERRKPAGQNQDSESDLKRNKPLKDLPPQLRASVFFEPPTASVDIKVREASAGATFDSILDASARAPVTAFTDHPFAGQRGSDIYGNPGHKVSPDSAEYKTKRQSHRTFLSPKQTEHNAADAHEDTALRSDLDSESADGSGDESSEYDGSDRSYSENEGSQDEEDNDYMGTPNTLLAELQLRKQELQQRRRTFGNSVGMHSTLLELDAVAQRQKDQRQRKRVTLAWEGPDLDIHNDPDYEDVPLAMLYPERANASADARPLGLLEQRQQEENEPLSRRRARLRGEALPTPAPLRTRPSTVNFQPAADPDSGNEETLGQRQKRLRAKDRGSVAGQSDFTVEVLAELSQLNGQDERDEQDKENETLGQRRTRLQRESKLQNNLNPKTHRSRQSMADILRVRPATMALQPSHEPVVHRNSMDSRFLASQLSMHPAPFQFENMTSEFPRRPRHERANISELISRSNTFYSDAILGMNSLAYANPHHAKTRAAIESGQRDMINRWRQSVN